MESNRWLKPWLIIPPKVLLPVLLVLGLLALCEGIYMGFFKTRGFESATAVIVRIDGADDAADAAESARTKAAFVTYTVDGREYTEKLDTYADTYEVGKEVRVRYDPADPANVRTATMGFASFLWILAATLLAAPVYFFFRDRRRCRAA